MSLNEHTDADNHYDVDFLKVRVDGIEETTKRHEQEITKLDEAVTGLRESMARVEARVATRADIESLRRDVTNTFAASARDAQNSIPVKVSAWFTVALVVVTALAFLASLFVHH